MPDSHGFLHLSDAAERIVIECAVCGRRGEYDRQRAIATFTDLMLPDFLARVRNCANFNGVNSHQCGASFSARSLPVSTRLPRPDDTAAPGPSAASARPHRRR